MFCVLVGVVPPDDHETLWEIVPQEVTSVVDDDGDVATVEWRSHSLVTDEGIPTLIMSAVSEAPATPEAIVAAVEAALWNTKPPTNNTVQQHYSCEMWASAPAPLPLLPSRGGGYNNILSNKTDEEAPLAMREWGLVVQRALLDAATIAELGRHVTKSIDEAERQLELHRPNRSDSFCFREIASRGQGRFDLRLYGAANELVETHIRGHPRVAALLEQSLGSPNEIDFDVSVVYSRPGAPAQAWHADGDHQKGANDAGWKDDDDGDGWKTRLADAYALCLFIPLVDLNDTVGYTQFWPASHRHRELLGFGKVAELTQATFDGKCAAGDGIWYDYRLFHRGMANHSKDVVRPVVQVVFKKKWYVEKANYGEEPIRMIANEDGCS
jgi:ectoine hydroxylase-related dioxygenase (phytanoyl-CoA dioxygenase family)